MAGIDKIYATIDEAKEFINWVESTADYRFKEYFREAGNVSIKNFMYVQSLDDLNDIICNIKEFPITNFPTIVDKWMLAQNDLPKFAYDAICDQYGLTSNEDIENFITTIEMVDTRPIGKHVKILSRSGVLSHSNYFENGCCEIDDNYYRRNWLQTHYPNLDSFERWRYIDEYYEKSIDKDLEDIWWFKEKTNEWENCEYPKKKNICSGCSSCQIFGKTSLKAIIRNIIKRQNFPIGTIIRLTDFRYIGEIYLKVVE